MNINTAVGEEFDPDDHHQLVREMERSTESPDVVENPLSASNRRSSSQSAVLLIKFLGSLVCLSVGILTWILMAEILQGLFKEYPKPYFLAFWIHSYYSVMYVVWKVWREFPGNCKCNASGDGAIHWKSALWGSFITGMVALVCGYFWYLSLTRTSVPANTAIYQSCVAFVFILSVPILKERVTIVKIFAVLFAVGGVTMISFFSEKDETSVKNTPLGFVYLIVSTILYALLEVLFKKFASPKDDPSEVCNSIRYVGLMGVQTLLWAWIPIVILHFSGVEEFEWPSLHVMKLMFLNAFMDVVYNMAIFLCIALSSPLFASAGVITAIPVSIVVEFLIHHKTSSFQVYLGMMLIIIGFIGFCVSEIVAARRVRKEKSLKSIQVRRGSNSTIDTEDTSLLFLKKKETVNYNGRSSIVIHRIKEYVHFI